MIDTGNNEIMLTKSAPIPASLAVWTGYLMNRAGQQCRDHFNALMGPTGVTGRHFAVLTLLDEQEPPSQAEMGERLAVDRNTMVLLLDDLEQRGLVTRRRDPRDRRAYLVSLTDEGRDVLAEGVAMARRTNDEVLSPLDPAERAQLHSLLRRLFETAEGR